MMEVEIKNDVPIPARTKKGKFDRIDSMVVNDSITVKQENRTGVSGRLYRNKKRFGWTYTQRVNSDGSYTFWRTS
jgi:hypothetical protein